uniref:Uncharacterized protein n=1 Tax=Solanum lycopersicum TaxID=4081 RepID=A0A494G8W1_SOLLC
MRTTKSRNTILSSALPLSRVLQQFNSQSLVFFNLSCYLVSNLSVLTHSKVHLIDFFEYISLIVTTSSASSKRRDASTEAQHQDILNRLESGEISIGRGLHQASSLVRPWDTRWGSHHTTLLHLDQMWSSVSVVLSMVDEDARGPSQVAGLIEKMESFKFGFILKLMLKLFGITNELLKILQRS